MKTYVIKIEQYLNKWVTLIESKTEMCNEADALEYVTDLKKVILDGLRSEISDYEKGIFVIVDPATGPIRFSYKEAYFSATLVPRPKPPRPRFS